VVIGQSLKDSHAFLLKIAGRRIYSRPLKEAKPMLKELLAAHILVIVATGPTSTVIPATPTPTQVAADRSDADNILSDPLITAQRSAQPAKPKQDLDIKRGTDGRLYLWDRNSKTYKPPEVQTPQSLSPPMSNIPKCYIIDKLALLPDGSMVLSGPDKSFTWRRPEAEWT
jgi:hypothetical protein